MEMEHEDEDVGRSFAEAFDMDLAKSRLEQSEICEMLSEKDEVPISTAAISNWKKRDRIPYTRLRKLVDIFGPQSECAKYMQWVDTQEPSRLTPPRRPANTVATSVNFLMTGGKAAGEEVEQRLTRLLAVLYQIPESRRAAALRAATETLLDHLPPPPK